MKMKKPQLILMSVIGLACAAILIQTGKDILKDPAALSTVPHVIRDYNTDRTFYKVDRVVDGDTIRVIMNEKSVSIRLIGVNTPETVHPNKPVECFGKQASDFVKRLLSGEEVWLGEDSRTKDKYGRLLRYVYLNDDTLVNEVIISQGYGYENGYGSRYKKESQFKEAQADAEIHKRGLWADGACDAKSAPLIVVEGSASLPASTIQCKSNAYDCKSFKSQKRAQYVYDYCAKQNGTDIHKLDGNKDGIVCEGLP